VKVPRLVHIVESLHCLVKDVADSDLGKRSVVFFYHLVKILVHIFEYEVEFVVKLDYFVKFDYVWVVKLHERLDFG